MNAIQKRAAAAIRAHEAALTSYIAVSDQIPEPADGAPVSEWDAWGAACEKVREDFNVGPLLAERTAAETALLEWMVKLLKSEQPKAFTPELEKAATLAARSTKLRKQLVDKALRLEARS